MFYAVPRPTRDGSKVNVGRPGPGGSSGVVWKQELGGGGGGSSNNGRERGKSVLGERKKDRGTIGGQREGGRSSRSVQSERCEEMGLAGATVAPPWNPYREDASKGQVTSSCNPPSSPVASSPRTDALSASLSRAPCCSFFSFRPPPPRTPLPRGHVLPARDDLRLWGPHRDRPIGCEATPFRGLRWLFRGLPTHDLKIEIWQFSGWIIDHRSPVFPFSF